MNDFIYGIDLGTTYSAVTYVHPQTGQIQELIRLESNDFTLPSAVLFLPGRRVKVGQSAIENSYQPGTRLAIFPKRSIGLQAPPGWPLVFEDYEYYPEDVSALILRKIAQVIASPDINLPPPRRVVVTHPQYFWSNQKEATRQACELAGLEPIATLTEPHAAAIAYGAYETARREGQDLHVMVFDLGGGTLDVTVMHLSPQVMEVLASDGDARLGGLDWDQVLIDWAKEYFYSRTGQDLDSVITPEEFIELKIEVEKTKKKLSNTDFTKLMIRAGDYVISLPITRQDFESRSEPLVRRCLDRCEQALRKAGLRWDQIDQILLVGSSTQMPMIENALKSFGRPVQRLKDPKSVVAKGAALWGYWLQKGEVREDIVREEGRIQETVTGISLPDIKGATAHGIGVLVQPPDRPPWVDILIPPNTPTPYEVEKTYQTTKDNATRLEIPLYESDSNRPDEGLQIGKIVIDGLPPRPKGQPVKVSLKIDLSGLLTVEVIDQDTGRRQQKKIDRSELAQGLSQRWPLAQRKAHLDRLVIED